MPVEIRPEALDEAIKYVQTYVAGDDETWHEFIGVGVSPYNDRELVLAIRREAVNSQRDQVSKREISYQYLKEGDLTVFSLLFHDALEEVTPDTWGL